MQNTSQSSWGSSLGFLLAAIGSAVGLGNIWGFPYKMGESGGFAFLLIYVLLTVFVGSALLLSELALGRKTLCGPISAYRRLSKRFKWVGIFGVLSSFLILAFYCPLGGYCIRYFCFNVQLLIGVSAQASGAEIFSLVTEQSGASVFFTLVFLAATAAIVLKGVSGGIEKFSTVAMPLLFLSLIALAVRSVTLPGAERGLDFMFSPNLEPLKQNFLEVLATAGGQMFFSLSLGMGTMIAYGAYLDKSQNLQKSAVIIPIADMIIALLAGLAILPAAFALGGEGGLTGPNLLFVTLQDVFYHMGYAGPLFGALFYLLVTVAALTSSISMLEPFVASLSDLRPKLSRAGSVALAAGAAAIPAVIISLDGMGSSGIAKPFGYGWLDFFNLLSEGVIMPVGSLLTALFIGYELGAAPIAQEVELSGRFSFRRIYSISIKYLAPPLLLLILFAQLRDFGII